MKNRKDHQGNFADRMVMAGGFLAVLCTGFFGAEPALTEGLTSLHTIPYIQLERASIEAGPKN